MSKTIEVEMRGPLSSAKMSELTSELTKKGEFIECKERVLIDYSTFLPEGGIRGRKVDIRLRNTNNVSEIIIKTGAWGGSDARREFSIKSSAPFDTLVQVYRLLGYSKGVLCVRNISVYKYKGIELAVVEVPGHSFFFEAEIELSEENEKEKAQTKLREVLHSLSLDIYSDSEYFDYIEILNKEANTIFDAEQESEQYFAEIYSI